VEWANETPKGLWKKIVEEVQTYYGYRLDWLVMMSVFTLSSVSGSVLVHMSFGTL